MTRLSAWLVAARPHTLPAAVAPVLVGAGLAAGDSVFRADALAFALVGAVAIQVAANFANDASDAARGADSEHRLGPPRMVSLGVISPRAMWVATWASVAVAAAAAAYLVAIAGWVIALVGLVSVAAMLGYVGGPFPYGYHGLGELFVFVFFGLVATVGSRYVHDRSAPLDAWLLAIPVGLLAAAILVVNNVRDIDADGAVGKRTLAVVVGRTWTRRIYAGLVWGAFAVVALFTILQWTPPAAGLAVFLAPFGRPLVRLVTRRTEGPALIAALQGTARLQLLVGLVLAVGAALGR